MPDRRDDLVCSASELVRRRPPGLVLLDVRVDAGGRADRENYLRGHLPRAHFVDIDADLAGEVTPASGARPLPEPAALTECLRRWGLSDDSTVVVYDDSRSAAAARAWWVLRWAGLSDVRVLDGGLRAWIAARGPIAIGEEPDGDGDIEVTGGSMPVVDTDDVARLVRTGVVLDARPEADHLGHGHIPGAVAAPVFDDLDAHGRLRDHADLEARYRTFGVTDRGIESASYCGSGVAAALQVLVLESLGFRAALYPGSFSQWSADPARLVIRGALAGAPTSVPVGGIA
ncbi:sulfurtransferase [Gordonia sp. NPDC058843]|uniref:sulfurtransferase n=1 Tax=Gordonia sp. NPDC058843 TaxID=3346648 RepID=UPI0036C2012A